MAARALIVAACAALAAAWMPSAPQHAHKVWPRAGPLSAAKAADPKDDTTDFLPEFGGSLGGALESLAEKLRLSPWERLNKRLGHDIWAMRDKALAGEAVDWTVVPEWARPWNGTVMPLQYPWYASAMAASMNASYDRSSMRTDIYTDLVNPVNEIYVDVNGNGLPEGMDWWDLYMPSPHEKDAADAGFPLGDAEGILAWFDEHEPILNFKLDETVRRGLEMWANDQAREIAELNKLYGGDYVADFEKEMTKASTGVRLLDEDPALENGRF
mmetsp:Transcript_8117/g.27632  ORF Transcript_8117/g.27632 Transcript_8117/m.27632 type:complete len:271 (-) Transcript_8117:64-876(-)